jgi:hypothetical protein
MGDPFSIFVAIVSMVIQAAAASAARKRQKKMEREAKERADAAKGFQLAVEGEASLLPIQYGRGLLGGVRVYHNTSNTLSIPSTASINAAGGVVFNNTMASSRGGIKHEFLTVQVALAFAELTSCQMVFVDKLKYSDSKFNAAYGKEDYPDEGRLMGGHRIHFFPNGGNDPYITANFNSKFAPFTNTAYATCVFALNRDEYQYSGVPEVQFMVEGKKVRKIVKTGNDYSVSATKSYSNNPALCLLDYLMDPVYGRGLDSKYIDLSSFYYAMTICDTVVKTGVPQEGVFWKQKNLSYRDIKLYECNLTISPANSIRDNIETLLETMGQAELRWASGKYSISLEYPKIYAPNTAFKAGDVVQYQSTTAPIYVDIYRAKVNTTTPASGDPTTLYLNDNAVWDKDVIAAYLTDDDIVRDSENSVTWPNASERYNFVTVRYLNEAQDFVEDSVSWPFKVGTIAGAAIDKGSWIATGEYTQSDLVTYSSVKYQLRTGVTRVSATPPNLDNAWIVYNEASVYNKFREEDHGLPLEADFFEAGITDYYHALAKAEQRVRFSRSSTVYKFAVTLEHTNLEPGDLIKVNSVVLDIPGEVMRIEEIKVNDKGNAALVCGKFDANTLAWNVNDNEVIAPRNIFDDEIPQCTNLVLSTTNTAFTLTSGRLTWTAPSDIRVRRYRIKYTLTPALDVTNLAVWNDLGTTQNKFFDLPSLTTQNYTLTVISETLDGKSAPQYDINSKWPVLGVALNAASVDSEKFIPVTVYKRSATLPVKPTGGIFDFILIAFSELPVGWTAIPPAGTDTLYASQSVASTINTSIPDSDLTWTEPFTYSDTAAVVRVTKTLLGVGVDYFGNNAIYSEAFGTAEITLGGVNLTLDNDAIYAIVEMVSCEAVIDNVQGSLTKGTYRVFRLTAAQGRFKVKITFRGVVYFNTISVVSLNETYIVDNTPPPNLALSDITVNVGLSSVFITLNTTQSYTVGHGHANVVIYGSTTPGAVFADAVKLASFSNKFTSLARNVNESLRLWFKNETIDGVESLEPAGGTNGYDAHTLLLGPNDIAANAITAEKILVDQLSAVSANLGNIESGRIVLDQMSHIRSGMLSYDNGNGFFAGYEDDQYKFSIGSTSGNKLTWDGHTLNVVGGGRFSGLLEAATGVFSGELSAATGTFNGTLMAGVLDLESMVGVSYTYMTPGTYTVTVPPGRTSMRAMLVGGSGAGGGGGNAGNNDVGASGGAGGGSGGIIFTFHNLVPGDTYVLHVGAKGVATRSWYGFAHAYGFSGGDGGDTYIENLAISSGGKGGGTGNGYSGGAAGAAGGSGSAGERGYSVYEVISSHTVANPNYGSGIGGMSPTTTINTYSWQYNSKGGAAGLNGKKGGNGGQGVNDGSPIRNSPASAIYGSDGGDGWATIEFFHPNAVVLKSQYESLKLALQTQGISTGQG